MPPLIGITKSANLVSRTLTRMLTSKELPSCFTPGLGRPATKTSHMTPGAFLSIALPMGDAHKQPQAAAVRGVGDPATGRTFTAQGSRSRLNPHLALPPGPSLRLGSPPRRRHQPRPEGLQVKLRQPARAERTRAVPALPPGRGRGARGPGQGGLVGQDRAPLVQAG